MHRILHTLIIEIALPSTIDVEKFVEVNFNQPNLQSVEGDLYVAFEGALVRDQCNADCHGKCTVCQQPRTPLENH